MHTDCNPNERIGILAKIKVLGDTDRIILLRRHQFWNKIFYSPEK